MSTTTERTTLDLATRLDRAESVEAIRHRMHTYAHAFDKRELSGFLSIWTEDAEWTPMPGTSVSGRAGIRQLTEQMWQSVAASHHWSVNAVIDVDGDVATAMTDVNALAQSADGGWAQTAATYRDTFRRVDGTWLLAKRETDLHHTFPVPDPVS
ncbi:nuclear transport factor 2 family protein [Prauserella oleivorans]|uniref:Nuclear transport factor 2 family protein n=1 Tax=Prauserella oleivorans TaxID=1478153 RepID=A0ABW5W5H7_9PSEU